MQDLANIPPTPTLREKLAATVAESRYLRSLLKIARQRDEAVRQRLQADLAESQQRQLDEVGAETRRRKGTASRDSSLPPTRAPALPPTSPR